MEKELGSIIQYVIDNFREGESLQFNKFKSSNGKENQQIQANYRLFESFLKSKDITNPYKDCAITKRKNTEISKLCASLALHDCTRVN